MRQACLVFLVFLVSSVSAVEEVYPRPWDDAGWVSENRYISDLGLWELWWTPVNPHVNLSEHEADSIIYAFQPSLEGLGLNRLCPESRETASEQGLGTPPITNHGLTRQLRDAEWNPWHSGRLGLRRAQRR